MWNRIQALIGVRQLIALVVVIVFAVLAIRKDIDPHGTTSIVTLILGYYYGSTHSTDDGGEGKR